VEKGVFDVLFSSLSDWHNMKKLIFQCYDEFASLLRGNRYALSSNGKTPLFHCRTISHLRFFDDMLGWRIDGRFSVKIFFSFLGLVEQLRQIFSQ
jgi:hypothetical protein